MSVRREQLLRLASLDQAARWRIVLQLDPVERRGLLTAWEGWAHPGQVAPAGDWRVWLIRAGRGFGKTRAGAEWVRGIADTVPGARIALVGSTIDDVRRVMVEGESGLIACAAACGERLRWRRDLGELEWGNGARAYVFSAEAAEKLRGPQHHAAWCDEVAKWRNGETAWDNLQFGLRLADHARVVVTTTPRPVPLMRRLLAMPDLVETRGSTADNPWLPAGYVAAVTREFGGTRLGRQELDGEMIEEVAGALWTRALIETCRVAPGDLPPVRRVVVGVDPPAGTASGEGGDACGIVAVMLGGDGRGYVLEDASVVGASPERWARAVVACARRHGADRVVAEVNQGGAMVKSVLHAVDAGLALTAAFASRGKTARAEPVAALYEGGRVRHRGVFPALEDELCGLVAGGGYEGPGRSPDRADALVWAVSELMLGTRGQAAVRVLG